MLPEDAEDWKDLDLTKFIVYGGSATLALDTALYPLELIKTRMQVEAKAEVTLLKAFRSTLTSTYEQGGVRGLYRGFALYTAGGLPSQG
jgi:hypothetical protein